jgi:hypothetical protein
MAFGFLKRLIKPVAKLFVKKGAKRTAQKTVQKGIKTGAKIAGKFDETIPMGFKPIQEIPKVGIPKQTLTKAQRLAASKAAISKLGSKADISKLGGKFKPPAPNSQRMTDRIARLTAKNKLTPAQEALRTTTQARKALGATIKPATIKPAVQPTLPAVSKGLSTGQKLGVAGVAGAGGIGIGVGINKKKKKKRK